MESLAVSVFSAIFSALLWGVGMKAAAWVYKRTKLSWLYCFIFAFLLFLVVALVRYATARLGGQVSMTTGLIVGFILIVLLGSWFFRGRAATREGVPLGWRDAAGLSTVFYLLIGAVGLSAVTLMSYLTKAPAP